MVVIAMTREMGTLGKDVAKGIADALDLEVVHHELVEHGIAERLGLNESAVHRYLEGEASLFERWKIDKHKLSRYTAQEILEFAQQGDIVIRGWGATALLQDVPNVLRVRVCAPMPFRVKVMQERLNLSDASVARREIERSDAAHAQLMQGMFGVDWTNPTLYHLVLNTGGISVESCVSLVRMLADNAAFKNSEGARTVLANKSLEWRIRAALSDYEGRALGVTGIEVATMNGRIDLTGTCQDPRTRVQIEKFVRALAGVKDVENRIVVVRSGWT